jgi:lipoprotein-anchoring transpeptidase ErfK/SrfK
VLAVAFPAAAQADVQVYFLKGEQVSPVTRPGSTAQDAATQLLAGPTDTEKAQGYRTYIPGSTKLRSVSVSGGIATVDLSLPFVKGSNGDNLRARLTQLVYTLTGPEGATKVQLHVAGGTVVGMFPGVSTSGPITTASLETPDVSPPQDTTPPQRVRRKPAHPNAVLQAQRRLIRLGYLIKGDADGRLGPATQAAVIAFQKWEGLSRDGVIGPQTRERLKHATRPTPITHAPGRRAEVLIDRQVTLAIRDNRVVRVLHVSTGKPSTPTTLGTYRVYAQFPKWWSTPFHEWLLWASPFNAGIAFHQFPDVPVYAASHGCVRITPAQALWMYRFLQVGDQVKVIARS